MNRGANAGAAAAEPAGHARMAAQFAVLDVHIVVLEQALPQRIAGGTRGTRAQTLTCVRQEAAALGEGESRRRGDDVDWGAS